MVNVNEIISNDFKLSKIASERILLVLIDEEGLYFRISVLAEDVLAFSMISPLK